jgi:hypothetical protein
VQIKSKGDARDVKKGMLRDVERVASRVAKIPG